MPQGAFGDRTFAGSSKVTTNTDQFSIRVDHSLSDKAELLTRFSLNQVTGPVTNPDQTAIDPTFGVQFFDHQRNAAVRYTRAVTSNLSFDLAFAYIRSTPVFPSTNHTDPALTFADGLYQSFNSAGGSITGSYSNLYQIRANATYLHGTHTFKFGYESRWNKDATIFGINPNGLYSFGGGRAYSPVNITSASGTHNINAGDPLPDALTGLLTATPYAYSVIAAASVTPIGDKFDEAAARREAYNFYFQDSWKLTPRLTMNYGLRYEVNSRIHEAHHRTSSPEFLGPDGNPAPYWDHTASQVFLFNPQPPYNQDWSGWGPRIALDYALSSKTVFHAAGAITTILPNLWQDNFLTGGVPLATGFSTTALEGVPIPFSPNVVPVTLPTPYSTDGQVLFPNGDASHVAPNSPVDLVRYQKDLAALTPGNQVQLLSIFGFARNFRNGYIGSWTAGIDHDIRDFHFSVAYVGTEGIHLAAGYSPNSYTGADPAFAPYTQFDSQGHAIGGLGSESIMTTSAHSSYNSLQASVTKNSPRAGLGLQASYTYGKSLDDTSTVLGGSFGASGVVLQTAPQNPWNQSVEKGPSTFDVRHVFAVSVIQLLPIDRVSFLQPLSKTITAGWQFLDITTVTSGSPFTVYSGIQQTGAGSGGTDRPDLAEMPSFSTSRAVREGYFGRGANNASFFTIPIDIPGGTGLGTLEFRAEFFNIFNRVNFGLPSNVVRGSGFGIISKTAGTSRQIQFSLKLIF